MVFDDDDELFFVVCLTAERRLALFLTSGVIEGSCAVVVATTARLHFITFCCMCQITP